MEAIKESPVKAVRLALNMTQEEMALQMGCSINTQRRCEYDGRLPSTRAVLDNFRKLAKKAGIKVL
jgi:transcriptional regulator with XRE-family HTH domain